MWEREGYGREGDGGFHKQGLISEESTGLPFSKAGTAEFIEVLTRKISLREGFGDILARGTLPAADILGTAAREIANRYVHTRSSEHKDYDPRMFMTTAIFYATEPRRSIHQLHGISFAVMAWLPYAMGMKDAPFTSDVFQDIAAKYWGGKVAADFTTYEGKGVAAKKVQDRALFKECMILCDLGYLISPNTDPTLEPRIYTAITGKEMTETGSYELGERVYNLQRAVQLRLGWGGRKGDRLLDHLYTLPLEKGSIFFNPDALVPGPDGKPVSKIGSVVDRAGFEKMLNDYYQARGWDSATGYPKESTLNRLGLSDIAQSLKAQGLLA